jgi:molecular chaperone HscB
MILDCNYEDYFSALEVPDPYKIEQDILERNFLQKMIKLHPDKFATAEAAIKLRALEHSAYINRAYETLRSEPKRLEYMLKQAGYDIDQAEITNNPELLMKVMMWREEEDQQLLLQNLQDIEKQYITQAFEALQQGQIKEASRLYTELKFLYRFKAGD